MKKKIYYWSPFLSPIATSRAVINSAYSLSKFGKNYESFILNFFNEYSFFEKEIKKKQINLINWYKFNFFKYLPYQGKLKSRLSFLILFILGIIPLINILKKNKPEYLIIQLITSLPLIILIFFNFETKFILRISGFPKLNFFRKILWKIALKKIHYVTCPTKNTHEYLKKMKLVDDEKLKILYDPIIDLEHVNTKKKEIINFKNYFLSIGRLTKQKNFLFLCEAMKELILEDANIKLLIVGNGEQKEDILKYISKHKLQNNIFLIGFKENVFPYLRNAKGFILSSLWEDPGFVLVEAGICRTPVLSSDAWPGPVEIIKDNFNGYLFKNNNLEDFKKSFKKLINNNDLNLIKLNHLKLTKKFTLFSHYQNITKLI